MDIQYIFKLASKFRRALDSVVDKRQYGRLTMLRSFPKGCCTYASDLLAEHLIENGVRRERIQSLSSESDKGYYSHCWLLIDDMYCLDITGDQFNAKALFKKYRPIPDCVIVPKGTSYFERFTNQTLQYTYNVGIDTYGGDTPEKLRVVYNAAINQIEND